MFDFWSVFRDGGSTDEEEPAAAPVAAFFGSIFKQPTPSDPSSWNDYTTGTRV